MVFWEQKTIAKNNTGTVGQMLFPFQYMILNHSFHNKIQLIDAFDIEFTNSAY